MERMIKWVFAMVVLCGFGHTEAFAYSYEKKAQSDWGYQPVYRSGAATDGTGSMPTYRFRSTSPYMSSLGEARADMQLNIGGGIRRTSSFDFNYDEDDPVGTVPDPVPVGDSPWGLMLLLAAGYIVYRRRRSTMMGS